MTNNNSLCKKIFSAIFVFLWITAGFGVFFFEINHSYSSKHSVVENIKNNGIATGLKTCFSVMDENDRYRELNKVKETSLKIRSKHNFNCDAMGTIFRETKINEKVSKIQERITHPFISSSIFLLIVTCVYVLVSRGKNKNLSGLDISLFFFGIMFMYLLFTTSYANIAMVQGKMGADPLMTTKGMRTIEYMGSLEASIKIFMRYMGAVLMQLAIILPAFGIGSFAFRKLVSGNKSKPVTLGSFVVATAIGFFPITSIMLILSMFKQLNAYAVWPMMLITAAISWSDLSNLYRSFIAKSVKWNRSILTAFIIALGMLVLASYQFQTVRPIPIGWDAVRTYMNNANLISQYEYLLPGFPMVGWTMVMSLGFIMWQNDHVAIALSSTPAILAFMGISSLLSKTIKEKYRSYIIPFVVLCFMQMPMMFFHMAQDDKVDLAILFFTAAAMITGLSWFKDQGNKFLLGTTGLLFGMAITVKMTAMLPFVIAIAAIPWIIAGPAAGVSSVILIFGLMSMKSQFGLPDMANYSLIGISLLGIIYTYIKQTTLSNKIVKSISILCLGAFLSVSLWTVAHVIEAGAINKSSVVFGGGSLRPAIDFTEDGLSKPEVNTASTEELGRYIGYEGGHFKASSFLVDMFTNRHQFGTYVTMSMAIFIIVPLLVFSMTFTRPRLVYGLLVAEAALYSFLTFFPTAGVKKFLWAMSATPSWILTSILLLLPLATIAIFSKKRATPVVILTTMTAAFWLIWLLIATGIVWYGLAGFIPLFIIIALLLQDALENKKQIAVIGCTVTLILTTFISMLENEKKITLHYGFIDYKVMERNGADSADINMKILRDIAKIINRDDESLILAVGTSLKYHVKKNVARYIHDDTVDMMAYITSDVEEWNDETRNRVVGRLYNQGIRYLLLDLNIHTVDATPGKTLTKKFKRAIDFAQQNPWLQVIGTDINERTRPRIIAYEILNPEYSADVIRGIRKGEISAEDIRIEGGDQK